MRQLAGLVAALVATSSCVHVEATTRTERGPLLRSYHRPQVLEGDVEADARVDWPSLKLTITGHDTCRDLEVEEYAEERITERSAPTAGPALSTGITTLLASAVLFGVSYALSAAPDTTVIDRGGNYGPSTQQLVRAWSLGAGIVGVPALAVGLIGTFQASESTEHLVAEQVINQHDSTCNPRPLTGPVTLQGPRGAVVTKAANDGAVDFTASEAGAELAGLSFGGRELVLDEASQRLFDAFSACAALEHEGAVGLEAASERALVTRLGRFKRCAVVRGEAVAVDLKAVDDALAKRREVGSPAAFLPTSEAASFEEAVAAWNPRLHLMPGSADLARLDDAAALQGQPALVQGVVVEGMTSNIGVLQVGDRALYVFLPPKRTWGFDFGNGTRVEAVVVLAGTQTVGERTLPLARAVWMRPAF